MDERGVTDRTALLERLVRDCQADQARGRGHYGRQPAGLGDPDRGHGPAEPAAGGGCGMTNRVEPKCSQRLYDHGRPAPRACEVCGLFGTCKDAVYATVPAPAPAPDAHESADGNPISAVSARMTLDEAYILHRWHKDAEADCAKRGDYGKALEHKNRAAEIGGVFWPVDAWERAWGGQEPASVCGHLWVPDVVPTYERCAKCGSGRRVDIAAKDAP